MKEETLVIVLNEGSKLELRANVYTFQKELRKHEDDKHGHFMGVIAEDGTFMFLNVKRILYFHSK